MRVKQNVKEKDGRKGEWKVKNKIKKELNKIIFNSKFFEILKFYFFPKIFNFSFFIRGFWSRRNLINCMNENFIELRLKQTEFYKIIDFEASGFYNIEAGGEK